MIKKVIVFGGFGFIGLKLATKLCELGFKVDVVDITYDKKLLNDIKKTYKKNIKFKKLDVTDIKFLKKIKTNDYYYVFDCAAFLGVDKIIKNSYESLRNNILSSLNISLFAKKQINLQKIIFMSSSEVYDGSLIKHINKPPNKEESNLVISELNHPRTVYMFSKIAGELFNINSKLPYLNLRLHNIFGPRMCGEHAIPTFIKKFSKNKKDIEIFNKNHVRSYIYIDEAIDQIIKISLNKKSNLSTLNIGSDKNVFKNFQLVLLIKKLMKAKNKIVYKHNKKNSVEYRKPSLIKLKKIIKKNYKSNFLNQMKNTIDYFRIK
tara:strand:- start:791 stop:1750 length:960 start_codon:yes stop_codon:yes gene_type:complete